MKCHKPILAILGFLLFGLALAVYSPDRAAAAGKPADLVMTVNGDVRLRIRRGNAAGSQHMFMQVDRAANGSGWDEDYDLGVLAGTNPILDTGVAVKAGDRLDVRLVGAGANPDTVRYSTDRDPRPGATRPRIVDHDVAGTRRLCGGGREGPQDVTDLYTTAAYLISLSCWEDGSDFDYNDFAVAVDYTPESVPPTPPPGPTPAQACVCQLARRKVPESVVNDALANPARYYGWQMPLDPGKPVSPFNPLRSCLALHHVGLDYHPTWNKPAWRVGCP